MMKINKIILSFIAVAMMIGQSYAQNFNDALRLSRPGLQSSARALGMGNSFTAVADDYSAVYFNPAGLGLIKRFEIAGSVNYNSYSNDVSFFENSLNSKRTNFEFNQLGIVAPMPTIKGSWVIAFGYNRSKDFNRTLEFDGFNPANNSMIKDITGFVNDEIPLTNDIGLAYEIRDAENNYIRDTSLINGMLNQSGMIKREGSINNWSAAASVEISKGLFIGGTFSIISGSFKSISDYYEDDSRNVYTSSVQLDPADSRTSGFESFYINDVIDWEMHGWDFKLGLLYQFNKRARFGFNVKFPTYYTIEEVYSYKAESQFSTGTIFETSEITDLIEYEVKTPFELSAGISSKLLFGIVSGEVKIIDYKQMEFTDGLGNQYRIDKNNEIEDLFRTTLNFNVGAELRLPVLPIRGRIGFIYNQSPFLDDPSKFDRKYFTLGAGIILGHKVSVDVAYIHGWWENYGDNYSFNVSRTFQDVSIDKLLFSISSRM
jgi:long-subunit fatty acid transport protein